MTPSLYILLTVEIIIVFALISYLQKFLQNKNILWSVLVFVLKVVIVLGDGLMLIAFAPKIVWQHEYPFASLYLVLFGDVVKDIICFIYYLIKKNRLEFKIKTIVSGILVTIYTLYSVINMQTIVANYHTIKSDKLNNEYKLVFFADLHYGSSQSKKTVDDALDEIKGLNPDYLLLGGDITDENTTKEEMEYLYQKIGSLNIPTYFIYGNHDRQERAILNYGAMKYTEQDLVNAITSNNITILYEDYVEINDDLIIIGREDPSHPDLRKEVSELPEVPRDHYIISLEHTPYQNEDIIEFKADLQLSGHTHAAQFFPIQTVYKLINLNTFGDYYIGDTHLYISSGIAGWALPLRSEEHCNYEVIDLIPE